MEPLYLDVILAYDADWPVEDFWLIWGRAADAGWLDG